MIIFEPKVANMIIKIVIVNDFSMFRPETWDIEIIVEDWDGKVIDTNYESVWEYKDIPKRVSEMLKEIKEN